MTRRPQWNGQSMIQCPHCGTFMPNTARFCPGCGAPRTAVREELTRQAAETGVPFEELLKQERERDRQAQANTWATPMAPPQPPASRNRGWMIAGIIGGVVLLICIICGVIGLIAYQRAGVSIGEGDAGAAAREQLLLGARGQWDAQWELLHPAHQGLVSREEFVDCGRMSDLRDINIVLEFNEDHEVSGLGQVETRIVTYTATLNGQNIVEAVRMLRHDGQWRWLMDGDDLLIYGQGRCP